MRYLIAFAFASAGVGLGVVNTWNNAMAVNGGTFQWNDLTMLVAGLAITAALLSASLVPVSRMSKMVGVLCMLAIAGCVFVSVGYTLSRVGSVADDGASGALAHNAKIERVEREIKSLTAKRDVEEANGGCGKNCRNIERRLEAQRAALAGLGANRVVDPAGERLEVATFGLLTAARYRTLHPVITATTLELSVSLLLTISGLFAASGKRREPITIDLKPIDPVSIALQSGPASNRELAKRLGWTESRTSRAVQRLTDQRLVTVCQDGRGKRIEMAVV